MKKGTDIQIGNMNSVEQRRREERIEKREIDGHYVMDKQKGSSMDKEGKFQD